MFARNLLRTWAILALLLAAASVAWAPPEPPLAPRTSAPESLAASNVGGEIVITPPTLVAAEYSPAIAYNSVRNEYLVVWEVDRGGGYHDIHARRVAGDGRLRSDFSLATGHSQTNPAVAYDPVHDHYLIVWAYDYDGTGRDWDIYGTFIPWNGPQNNQFTAWPVYELSSNEGHPAVAYGGNVVGTEREFLVVWKSQDGEGPGYIKARRIYGATGFASDPFTISSGSQIRDFPDVAYNLHRNEYLVTWDLELTASNIDIWGMRLRGDGVPLTGGNNNPPTVGEFVIAGWPSFEAAPAVAACDKADQYLVVWQSDQTPGPPNYAIYARYISGDAVPGGVYEIDDTTSPELNVDVDCNFAGGRYLLAWQSRYALPVKYGIWARAAWPNESLSPFFEVKPPGSSTDREYPAVAGGRTGYLVAWEHVDDLTGNRDIHGRLVQHTVYLPLARR